MFILQQIVSCIDPWPCVDYWDNNPELMDNCITIDYYYQFTLNHILIYNHMCIYIYVYNPNLDARHVSGSLHDLSPHALVAGIIQILTIQ